MAATGKDELNVSIRVKRKSRFKRLAALILNADQLGFEHAISHTRLPLY